MSEPIVNVAVGGSSHVKPASKLNFVLVKANADFIAQINEPNTIYQIRWTFDLKGRTLNVPANCRFDFIGGQIKNGTIHWNNTRVINIYDYDILFNIQEQGTRITTLGRI